MNGDFMEDVLEVVVHVRLHAPKLKSDYARKYAHLIAAAASLGFITTSVCGVFTHNWVATAVGVNFTEERA